MMQEVKLHVYDVTNSDSVKTNNTIVQINRIFKDGIGLGGIFHSAIQVYGDEEWSFGYCERGTGVFSCPVSKNPMYTYRECITIGHTSCSNAEVKKKLRELSTQWIGLSYDLLKKNCNHFCDAFCAELGVPKIPGWVNRFANAGDTAFVVAGTTAERFKQAKSEVVNASKVAFRFISNLAPKDPAATPESPNAQNRGVSIPKFQATWLRSFVSPADKPSGSGSNGSREEEDDASSFQRQKLPERSPQPY